LKFESILNFAWIIGDTAAVSLKTQQNIDRLLSPFDVSPDTTANLQDAPELQETKDE
jgi:plasmid maintenance system antidote protein VapI